MYMDFGAPPQASTRDEAQPSVATRVSGSLISYKPAQIWTAKTPAAPQGGLLARLAPRAPRLAAPRPPAARPAPRRGAAPAPARPAPPPPAREAVVEVAPATGPGTPPVDVNTPVTMAQAPSTDRLFYVSESDAEAAFRSGEESGFGDIDSDLGLAD